MHASVWAMARAVEQSERLRRVTLREVVAIQRGTVGEAAAAAREVVAAGLNTKSFLRDGLILPIEKARTGLLAGSLSLSAFVASSRAAKAAVMVLAHELEEDGWKQRGLVVTATPEQEPHDAGNLLVGAYLIEGGFAVRFGRSARPDAILQTTARVSADVIALSATMRSSLPELARVIEVVEQRKLKVKVIVGGPACCMDWARSVGADGYGEDASEASRMVKHLMRRSPTKPKADKGAFLPFARIVSWQSLITRPTPDQWRPYRASRSASIA